MKHQSSTQKLSTFFWKGLNQNGEKKQGTVNAINIRFAKAQLQSEGIAILKIRRQSSFLSLNLCCNKITSKDVTLMMRQLATLLASGVPLLQALTAISNGCEKAALEFLLTEIKNSIQKGHTLSSSLEVHARYFDNLTCSLIAAGEQSGTLDVMLDRIAIHKEKTEVIKNRVKKALFYPCAVISIATIITTILLIFVVPQFAELFSGFGAQLPLLTRAVINLADFLKQNWLLILLCPMLTFSIIPIIKKRNQKLKNLFDVIVLKIPVFGKIIQKSIIARIMRTLATTSATGVPLLESLMSLKNISNNHLFQQALTMVYQSVKDGQTLHSSLKTSKLFPGMAIQMIAIGEEAGKLSNMLTKAADFYEEEVNQLVEGLSQLLEPLIMAILGVMVGGLVIAMYLPIFKLGTVI